MELSKDFVVGQKTFYGPDDPTQLPLDLAEVYVTGGEYGSAAVVLSGLLSPILSDIWQALISVVSSRQDDPGSRDQSRPTSETRSQALL